MIIKNNRSPIYYYKLFLTFNKIIPWKSTITNVQVISFTCQSICSHNCLVATNHQTFLSTKYLLISDFDNHKYMELNGNFFLPKIIVVFRTDLHKMKINTELCCKRYDFLTKKTLDDNIQIYLYGLLCKPVLSMRTV